MPGLYLDSQDWSNSALGPVEKGDLVLSISIQCNRFIRVKLLTGFYIPFSSQGQSEIESKYCHLWEPDRHRGDRL